MRLSLLTRFACFLLMLSTAAVQAAELHAGAGKGEIRTTTAMWPVDGFTSQHDPLFVRVLLLEDGTTRAALVVMDQTSISDGIVAETKGMVTRLTGASAEKTLVIASHTFSAPHFFGAPPAGAGRPGGPGGAGGPGGGTPGPAFPAPTPGALAYSHAIQVAVETAATQAKTSLQPARVSFGTGVSDVSVNRDTPTPQGWWLGSDPAGFSDTSLAVIRIDSTAGVPLAVLFNEAVQSSIMDQSVTGNAGKPVTADLAGAATNFVEQQYGGGAIAFFLIGAAGDQAPVFQGNRYVLARDGSTKRVDIHEAGFTLVDLLGERLGSEALQISEQTQPVANPSVQVERRTVEVPSQEGSRSLPKEPVKSYPYKPGPTVQVPIVLVRLGDIAIVGLQAELAASVGAELKAHSPFPHTLVVTMVDGGAKYMPDEKSYDRFTYEARNSRYARGAAEKVAAQADSLLKEMR